MSTVGPTAPPKRRKSTLLWAAKAATGAVQLLQLTCQQRPQQARSLRHSLPQNETTTLAPLAAPLGHPSINPTHPTCACTSGAVLLCAVWPCGHPQCPIQILHISHVVLCCTANTSLLVDASLQPRLRNTPGTTLHWQAGWVPRLHYSQHFRTCKHASHYMHVKVRPQNVAMLSDSNHLRRPCCSTKGDQFCRHMTDAFTVGAALHWARHADGAPLCACTKACCCQCISICCSRARPHAGL
jgi:hypothetical protein